MSQNWDEFKSGGSFCPWVFCDLPPKHFGLFQSSPWRTKKRRVEIDRPGDELAHSFEDDAAHAWLLFQFEPMKTCYFVFETHKEKIGKVRTITWKELLRVSSRLIRLSVSWRTLIKFATDWASCWLIAIVAVMKTKYPNFISVSVMYWSIDFW